MAFVLEGCGPNVRGTQEEHQSDQTLTVNDSVRTCTVNDSILTVTENDSVLTFTVNGVSFNMVAVEGGTFTMGATPEQGSDTGSEERPTHSVTLSDFLIGETEVTQELWQAVMGSNPSKFYGINLPVESVSWRDCQVFITKLNRLTSRNFRLPTEAEWEYAARGGNKSMSYRYAGSNNLSDVAWYDKNSSDRTHTVKLMQPNELGLYDMSGNVGEWCQDWYGCYSSNSQTNPTGPESGSDRVLRGGGWTSPLKNDYVAYRNFWTPTITHPALGLRLALTTKEQLSTAPAMIQTFAVNGVSFTMVNVEGGTFMMGASNTRYEESPTHSVTLSDFSIGETEVTQELWQAVMGNNPSYFPQVVKQLPVEWVSWNDCQEFITQLNQLTDKKFRLPTEAEWEYAARGGNKSEGYQYAGSNNLNHVAWYWTNGSSETHPVKQKQPNELGLYDMSGNVWEWCQDWFGYYSSSSQTNPMGPESGSERVYRGGSWGGAERFCRVLERGRKAPWDKYQHIGLRLAL